MSSAAAATLEDTNRLSHEQFWVSHFHFLQSRGYLLRPRYHPEWIPSWCLNDNLMKQLCEDHLIVWNPNLMDAVRIQDGTRVVLKIVEHHEWSILRHLTTPQRRSDPRNRTVHILDEIRPEDDDRILIAMPLLHLYYSPPFQRIGEIFEAIRQFLSGLEFMHENRVAHRDACRGNLAMDITRLIPDGFHFALPSTRDGSIKHPIRARSRSSVPPLEYFFIDFGVSYMQSELNPDPMGHSIVGQDKTVPEFQDKSPAYDPYKVDIYQLGNAVARQIMKDKYYGLEVLRPLTEAMTRDTPADRPSASEALEILSSIERTTDPRLYIGLETDSWLSKALNAFRNSLLRMRSGVLEWLRCWMPYIRVAGRGYRTSGHAIAL